MLDAGQKYEKTEVENMRSLSFKEMQTMIGLPVYAEWNNPNHNYDWYPTHWGICHGDVVHFSNGRGNGCNLGTASLMRQGVKFYASDPNEVRDDKNR